MLYPEIVSLLATKKIDQRSHLFGPCRTRSEKDVFVPKRLEVQSAKDGSVLGRSICSEISNMACQSCVVTSKALIVRNGTPKLTPFTPMLPSKLSSAPRRFRKHFFFRFDFRFCSKERVFLSKRNLNLTSKFSSTN